MTRSYNRCASQKKTTKAKQKDAFSSKLTFNELDVLSDKVEKSEQNTYVDNQETETLNYQEPKLKFESIKRDF